MYECVLLFGPIFPLFPDGGSASPFIDEGAGFTRVRALGHVLYLVLWLMSTRSGPSVRRKISAYNVVDVSVGCQVSHRMLPCVGYGLYYSGFDL